MGVFCLAFAMSAGEALIEVGLSFPANTGAWGVVVSGVVSEAADGAWFAEQVDWVVFNIGGGSCERQALFSLPAHVFIWCLTVDAFG